MWRKILKRAKHSFRKVFNARGGGLYACGFVVTFIYLETRMFALDIVEADGIRDFVSGQAMEMLFRYFTESIVNSIQALIWPVHVIRLEPPWGFILLAAMYLIFATVIKKPLQRWLFDEESESAPES